MCRYLRSDRVGALDEMIGDELITLEKVDVRVYRAGDRTNQSAN
jgi:hypothetical protein